MSDEIEQPQDDSVEESEDQVFEETKTAVNRSGYSVLLLLAAALSVPLIIGVAKGTMEGRVWDPATGELVRDAPVELDACEQDARTLLGGEPTSVEREAWRARCAKDHPKLDRLF